MALQTAGALPPGLPNSSSRLRDSKKDRSRSLTILPLIDKLMSVEDKMISDNDVEVLKKLASAEKRRIVRMLTGAMKLEDDVFFAVPSADKVIEVREAA